MVDHALAHRERGAEEGLARDVVRKNVRSLASTTNDPRILGAGAVHEGRLHEARRIETGQIGERAVDSVHDPALGDDRLVAFAPLAIEVSEDRVVRRDQDGGACLRKAVPQPGHRCADLGLERAVLLALGLSRWSSKTTPRASGTRAIAATSNMSLSDLIGAGNRPRRGRA